MHMSPVVRSYLINHSKASWGLQMTGIGLKLPHGPQRRSVGDFSNRCFTRNEPRYATAGDRKSVISIERSQRNFFFLIGGLTQKSSKTVA
jgi:hypothetical protein